MFSIYVYTATVNISTQNKQNTPLAKAYDEGTKMTKIVLSISSL